jgi:FlgD Ig-like domain
MRKRALWFFPAVLILLASSSVHAVTIHDWSKAVGGASVKMDASGNVILVGGLYGTQDFGGGPLTSAGFTDVVVAKYDANGNHLWSKRFGDENDQVGEGVAVDASGNIVIAGWFTGTVDFGGGPLTSAGYDIDIFVAKFDADGNHLWSKRFDCSIYGVEVFATVAVDGSDNVVMAEPFVGTVDFGGGPLTSTGIFDIAVAKFDASGGHIWSQRFGNDSYLLAQSIAADGPGNVVITGYFAGTVDFGGGPLSSGGSDMFLAEFDADGNHLWSKVFATAQGRSVTTDGSGDVIVTGFLGGTADFGGGPLTSAGSLDIAVAKFDVNGNHIWSRNFGDADQQQGQAVAVDGSGDVVLTGRFWGTVDFGGGPLTASPFFNDIFIAKLDADGNHIWSQRFGGDYSDGGVSIGGGSSGSFVVTGYFSGDVDFGGGPLSGGQFLVKFINDEPIPVLISSFNATPRNGAVTVTWNVRSDEALQSYTLYRHDDAHPQAMVVAEGAFNSSVRSYVDTSVEPAKTYRYELLIHTQDGNDFRSAMATVTMPHLRTTLGQNYPNPFRPETSIEYTLGERSNAVVGIYDASGRLVARLDQGVREAGTYRAEWNGRDSAGSVVGSGVYFYRLEGVPNVTPKKMVRLK